MPDVVVLILAASGTAVATGVGAIPVFLLGRRAAALTSPLLGFAAGAMTVAAFTGLLLPAAEEGSAVEIAAGFVAGVAFVGIARRLLPPERGFLGRRGPDASASALVFLVLFVHSLPEGLAVGTAYASDRAGLSLFVILAIAIQNVPEGTSIALPMHEAGFGPWRQFWVAVATSIPQPIGAVIAWLAVEAVSGLLPISFGFAAGAMLTIVAIEMAPRALAGRPGAALLGAVVGGGVMGALSLALGV
ncbi:MAG: ZIP family metal transporter [Actinobacteria bacterium]|nr:ZIP family metal transporter [Actinomycetota bacterium]